MKIIQTSLWIFLMNDILPDNCHRSSFDIWKPQFSVCKHHSEMLNRWFDVCWMMWSCIGCHMELTIRWKYVFKYSNLHYSQSLQSCHFILLFTSTEWGEIVWSRPLWSPPKLNQFNSIAMDICTEILEVSRDLLRWCNIQFPNDFLCENNGWLKYRVAVKWLLVYFTIYKANSKSPTKAKNDWKLSRIALQSDSFAVKLHNCEVKWHLRTRFLVNILT